ncbi:MAG: recombinase family protein [Thiotrichales bacterium]
MADIGYVRVSSVSQNTARQLDGVALDKVFEEKVSGRDINRPQLQACLDWAREGDVLHVHSIDRLARNLLDLEKIVTQLNDKGVSVCFHKESLTFSGGDDPMQKLMRQVFGAFAEFTRAMIRENQREGIAKAKAEGKQIGAKKKLNESQIKEIMQKIASGTPKSTLAKEYGVSRQTLYSALQQ